MFPAELLLVNVDNGLEMKLSTFLSQYRKTNHLHLSSWKLSILDIERGKGTHQTERRSKQGHGTVACTCDKIPVSDPSQPIHHTHNANASVTTASSVSLSGVHFLHGSRQHSRGEIAGTGGGEVVGWRRRGLLPRWTIERKLLTVVWLTLSEMV